VFSRKPSEPTAPGDMPPTSTDPTRPNRLMKLIIVAAVSAWSSHGLLACASAQDRKRAAESTYLGQQLACVEKAETRTESEECRRKVRDSWRWPDAGDASR
jgi:hypothetical protein